MNNETNPETIEAKIIEGSDGMVKEGAIVYDSTNDKTYMVHKVYSGTYFTCRPGGNSIIVDLVLTSDGWDSYFTDEEYFDCQLQIL